MRLNLLLINPWVYDFAAVNLWSFPLGLFEVGEYMRQYRVTMRLIDCMRTERMGKFGTGKYRKRVVEKPDCLKRVPRIFGRYGIDKEEFTFELLSGYRPDAVLITCIMSYWYPGVRDMVHIVRQAYPEVPIILGGSYATLWYDHAVQNSGVDVVYRGHTTDSLRDVFVSLGLPLELADENERGNIAPFDYPFVPLLTSKGCPFHCPYCASPLMQEKFIQLPIGEILDCIRSGASIGIRDFAFYDDALLVNRDIHIKPLLREIAGRIRGIRFHCPNGLHARHIDEELACLMQQAGFVTIRLGLETTNRERQQSTGGKVTAESLITAISCLKKHGFTKKNIGVYLMSGLPGQDIGEIRDGVQFLKRLGVRIHLNEFSPIPGTPCWDELVQKGIIDENIDPLLTNNSVFSYLFSRYDPDMVRSIKNDIRRYNAI